MFRNPFVRKELEGENCKNCWGKGYCTVLYGLHGAEDLGNKGFDVSPSVHIKLCTCDRAKQIKKYFSIKSKYKSVFGNII